MFERKKCVEKQRKNILVETQKMPSNNSETKKLQNKIFRTGSSEPDAQKKIQRRKHEKWSC